MVRCRVCEECCCLDCGGRRCAFCGEGYCQEDADFDEFLALTEMSELPENANVKLVPSVSGGQSLSVGLRGLT